MTAPRPPASFSGFQVWATFTPDIGSYVGFDYGN